VQQKEISYKIEFKIIEKNLDDSLIKLNLKYPKPSNLSLNSTDILKLRTFKRIRVHQKEISTTLQENTESDAQIP
jgi:hypothetical protein